jgi:hypothetical protein
VIDAAVALHPLIRAGAASSLPPVVASIAAAAEPWKTVYGDSKALATAVVFAHLGAMLVGGGLAFAADRATLRLLRGVRVPSRDDAARGLADLGATHRPVVAALAVMFVSGVLLFLSDVETFWGSAVYWIKMALVAALLVNGFLMTRAESALERAVASGATPDASVWSRLRVNAVASAALWLATLLAGVALANS